MICRLITYFSERPIRELENFKKGIRTLTGFGCKTDLDFIIKYFDEPSYILYSMKPAIRQVFDTLGLDKEIKMAFYKLIKRMIIIVKKIIAKKV